MGDWGRRGRIKNFELHAYIILARSLTANILHIFERIAIQVLYEHFRGSEAMLILLIKGGGFQNSGKPANIILARSLTET